MFEPAHLDLEYVSLFKKVTGDGPLDGEDSAKWMIAVSRLGKPACELPLRKLLEVRNSILKKGVNGIRKMNNLFQLKFLVKGIITYEK